MARGFSIVFAIVIFTILALSASGSPIKKEHEHVAVEKLEEESSVPIKAATTADESRKERQYGQYPNSYGSGGNFANADARAQASTNSFEGGNFGNFANADARAQASTNSFEGGNFANADARAQASTNSFGGSGNFANAQAQASASTNSFGGSGNFANADARAQASTNSFGGYGK